MRERAREDGTAREQRALGDEGRRELALARVHERERERERERGR